jgi:hypothetical protein
MEESIKSASKRLVQYWDLDSVHMTTSGYKVVTAAVIELLGELDKNNQETIANRATDGIQTGCQWCNVLWSREGELTGKGSMKTAWH